MPVENPQLRALNDALRSLGEAARDSRWEPALDAAAAARAALDWLIADDPELPADVWIGGEDLELLAGAVRTAIERDQIEIAAQLLAAAPGGALGDELERGRATVQALCSDDPELALVMLATTTSIHSETIQALFSSVAERIATVLDGGAWERRMLGVTAIGFAVAGVVPDYEAVQARRVTWAAERNLHHDSQLLDYVLVAMCARREGVDVDLCAASHGGDLFEVSGRLFEHALAAATRRLDAGSWSRAFSTFATGALLDGRDAELRDRIAALTLTKPGRAKLLASNVDSVRERIQWRRSTSQYALEMPESGIAESIGTFELESGVLTIGDPGYANAQLRFHVLAFGATCGTWQATVIRCEVPEVGRRCTVLLAHHVDHPCSVSEPIWTHGGSIDVEYGLAGLFDCAHYYDLTVVPLTAHPPREGENPWFDMCLIRAHGPPASWDDAGAGVVPFGCVSASGRGDGAYTCHVARLPDATVVATCLVFPLSDDAA